MKNLRLLLKTKLRDDNFRFYFSFFLLQLFAIPFVYIYKINFDNVPHPIIESIITAFFPTFVVIAFAACFYILISPLLIFIFLDELYDKIEKKIII
jgi:hypothetical protein